MASCLSLKESRHARQYHCSLHFVLYEYPRVRESNDYLELDDDD